MAIFVKLLVALTRLNRYTLCIKRGQYEQAETKEYFVYGVRAAYQGLASANVDHRSYYRSKRTFALWSRQLGIR